MLSADASPSTVWPSVQPGLATPLTTSTSDGVSTSSCTTSSPTSGPLLVSARSIPEAQFQATSESSDVIHPLASQDIAHDTSSQDSDSSDKSDSSSSLSSQSSDEAVSQEHSVTPDSAPCDNSRANIAVHHLEPSKLDNLCDSSQQQTQSASVEALSATTKHEQHHSEAQSKSPVEEAASTAPVSEASGVSSSTTAASTSSSDPAAVSGQSTGAAVVPNSSSECRLAAGGEALLLVSVSGA